MNRNLIRIACITLEVCALICFAICIFEDGKNQLLLNLGLMFNAIAFLIFCIQTKMRKDENKPTK